MPIMSVDRGTVLKVARLAHLELDEAELDEMATKLSGILAYVERLNQLDVSGIEPTSHVLDVVCHDRGDDVVAGLSHEQALANGPQCREGLFVVPRVMRDK